MPLSFSDLSLELNSHYNSKQKKISAPSINVEQLNNEIYHNYNVSGNEDDMFSESDGEADNWKDVGAYEPDLGDEGTSLEQLNNKCNKIVELCANVDQTYGELIQDSSLLHEDRAEDIPDMTIERVPAPVVSLQEEPVILPRNIRRNGEKSSKNGIKCDNKKKHPILEPCNEKCKRKCRDSMSEDWGRSIYERYWEKDVKSQREFILQRVEQIPKERERPSLANEDKTNRRQWSRKYSFKLENGESFQVCSDFFHHSLGYRKSHVTDWIFKELNETPCENMRGKHEPSHKLTNDARNRVIIHIRSFHPAISHYRRAHAPLRRYLDPSLSVEKLYDYYKETYPQFKISKSTYYRTFMDQNIGFTKLGEEECEECVEFKKHECANNKKRKRSENGSENVQQEEGEDCEICKSNESHLLRAAKSRKMYRKDVKVNKESKEDYLYSMDMQKVLMLPHLPGIKTALFTRRIIMINHTIAPLGGIEANKGKPSAYVWHEGLQGRNDEDVASAVVKFLKSESAQNCCNITIWCDNCSGQNKNWTLFGSFVHSLNDPDNRIESVTLKFFEKGHTFMSADSFHHQVEQGIREQGYLHNFQDFVDIVNKRGVAEEMSPQDFINFTNDKGNSKDVKCPLLNLVSVLRFLKGSTKLYYKLTFDQEEFTETEFLKIKVRKSYVGRTWKSIQSKGEARGITKSKKDDIINKLVKFLDKDKVKFWEDIPSSEASKDLSVNMEHLSISRTKK